MEHYATKTNIIFKFQITITAKVRFGKKKKLSSILGVDLNALVFLPMVTFFQISKAGTNQEAKELASLMDLYTQIQMELFS